MGGGEAIGDATRGAVYDISLDNQADRSAATIDGAKKQADLALGNTLIDIAKTLAQQIR